LQAYDLYLRGKSYARRLTRQDLEFSLRMFENAVEIDPHFALAFAAIANVCSQNHYNYGRNTVWMERAMVASRKAVSLRPELPEVLVGQAWIEYADGDYDASVRIVRQAIERKHDCEGAYYLLCRALFAAGRYQEVASIADAALEAGIEDYNVYVPILNSLAALGKTEAVRNVRHREVAALENHLKQVPEDARARIILAGDYAEMGREEDALRETQLAVTLRAGDANILYNSACVYSSLKRKQEAMDSLRKAWDAGFRDVDWVRRDPDLAFLRGEPEFDRLFPEKIPSAPPAKPAGSAAP
jgi:tetratricopeptide (TPR) repeat protein